MKKKNRQKYIVIICEMKFVTPEQSLMSKCRMPFYALVKH